MKRNPINLPPANSVWFFWLLPGGQFRYSGLSRGRQLAFSLRATSLRRGSLFHQTLVYMAIASSLITTAGICLHSVLRADVSERRESQFYNSLQRLEARLRHDSRQGMLLVAEPSRMNTVDSAGSEIRWTTDRGILSRVEKQNEQLVSSDRFVFPAGSAVLFENGTDNSVIVRITEPSAMVVYAAAANGGAHLNKPLADTNPPLPASAAQPHSAEIRLKGAVK